ncbi:helix-turn-helix domain-containing protein [Umezawaea sp. NPDC059074]|uniref:helix-turn-helix domain-containing protein n=1 Tax=Umezawaea sp. NPDC059074 TaxID=3346716 RepID=UPI00369CF55C
MRAGRPGVVEVPYDNPGQPRLGVEVVSFADLRCRLRPEVAAAPSRPDFHQLTLVTAGEGTAVIDFVAHRCAPGTLLHLRPGQVQRFPVDSTGGLADLDATMVLFTAAFPPPLPALASLTDHGPAAWTLGPADHSVLTSAVAEIAGEYAGLAERDKTLTVELLRHLLTALLLRVARLPRPDGGDPAAGGEVFRDFRALLEKSFATTRSVDAYASRLGYAPRTLARACLAATGRTAKQLIDDRVVLEGKRLLVHTDLPVSTIGGMLGFTEPTNFGKFFERLAHSTPGAFRADQA